MEKEKGTITTRLLSDGGSFYAVMRVTANCHQPLRKLLMRIPLLPKPGRSGAPKDSADGVIAAQLHLYRDRKAADSFANLLRLRVGEVQAHVAAALVTVVGVESISRDERNIFSERGLEERV